MEGRLPSEAPSLPRPGLIGIAALMLAGTMSGVGNGTLSAILPQI